MLKRESVTLALAMRHPKTPWYAKAVGVVVVAYALSPIDLIPDFIPVLGLLDDLLLVPLGIALVIKLTPREVMAECRERAETVPGMSKLAGAALILTTWIVVLGFFALFLIGRAS